MKRYPLHITHQLNDTFSLKTRIHMIFKEGSAQVKTWKYTSILGVMFLGLLTLACQKQAMNLAPTSTLLGEEYNTDVSNIASVTSMAFRENSKEWYFEIKEPQTVDFILAEYNTANFFDFQLFNDKSQLLASNQTGDTPAKGFAYKFNKTGTYYIKIDDLGDEEKRLVAAIFFKDKGGK